MTIAFRSEFEVGSMKRFTNIFSENGDRPCVRLTTIGCGDNFSVLKRVVRAGKRVIVSV